MGISSDALKLIAIISMTIDHIGAGLVQYKMLEGYDSFYAYKETYEIMRLVGRIAFPIFAYQLVVGFKKTGNRLKMIRNLIIFSVLSQLPFSLVIYGRSMLKDRYSTMFTLLMSFVMLCIIDYIKERFTGKIRLLLYTLTVTGTVFVCFCFHSDYDLAGVILIYSIYLLYDNKPLMCTLCPVIFVLSYILKYELYYFTPDYRMTATQLYEHMESESMAVISFILIYFDNNRRHLKGIIKYLGYIYYPLHLSIIYVMRVLMK